MSFEPEIVHGSEAEHQDAVALLEEALEEVRGNPDVTGVMLVIDRKSGNAGTSLKTSNCDDLRLRIGFLEMLKAQCIEQLFANSG